MAKGELRSPLANREADARARRQHSYPLTLISSYLERQATGAKIGPLSCLLAPRDIPHLSAVHRIRVGQCLGKPELRSVVCLGGKRKQA